MEDWELLTMDEAIDGIDLEDLTAEGIFSDFTSSVSKQLMQSFSYLESTFTFNITDFFDNALYTGIPGKIKRLNNNLGKLKDVSFIDIKDIEIVVTPGYELRIDNKAEYLIANINDTIKYSTELFNRYNKDLAMFITNEDKRNSKFYNKAYYSSIEKKQFKSNKEIIKLYSKAGTGTTTVGKLIGNMNGYSYTVNTMVDIFNLGIDEKDLKKLLSDIRDLKSRLNAVIEIINTENISKASINTLIAMNTAVANQYTLISKMYHMIFEVSQIVLNNKDVIFNGDRTK